MDKFANATSSVTICANTISKQAIARSFSRAAAGYDQHAVLQQEVGQRLLQRLSYTKLSPRRILDLGAGTGFTTKKLANIYPSAEIVVVDLAEGMLQFAQQKLAVINMATPLATCYKFCCADAEKLPFHNLTFDLIFSNLMLQWLEPCQQVFFELHRLLRPGGLLLFTSLGADTLHELRRAWLIAEQNVEPVAGDETNVGQFRSGKQQRYSKYSHVNNFVDMHLLGDSLLQAKFTDPVVDMEKFTLHYNSVRNVMLDLKRTGAHNMQPNRNTGITTKRAMAGMINAYEAIYKQPEQNTIPATFEIIYGQAWGTPILRRQFRDSAGVVNVPLEALFEQLSTNLPT